MIDLSFCGDAARSCTADPDHGWRRGVDAHSNMRPAVTSKTT